MDMVVGIIIGVVFMVIVKFMVGDLINLIIGLFLGGVDFMNFYIVFFGEVVVGVSFEVVCEVGVVVFVYGVFIMVVINFLIIVFVVFMFVCYVNKVKDVVLKKEEEVFVEEVLVGLIELDILMEIWDLLKK